MKRLVHGFGINDVDYIIQPTVNGKVMWCPLYTVWVSMLKRCYDNNYRENRPTYIGCTVCEEWLTFSKFKAWMEVQDYVGKQLDKDLLIQGNKVYEPTTCIFILSTLNTLLVDSARSRGDHPLGVNLDKGTGKFKAQVRLKGKKTYLGLFLTSQEAHKAWQKAKRDLIFEVSQEQTDKRLKNALLIRCNQLQFDIDNSLETIKL